MRTKRENLAKWIIYRFIMLFSLGDDRETMSREEDVVIWNALINGVKPTRISEHRFIFMGVTYWGCNYPYAFGHVYEWNKPNVKMYKATKRLMKLALDNHTNDY